MGQTSQFFRKFRNDFVLLRDMHTRWSFLVLVLLVFLMASCTDPTQTSNVFDPAKQASADEEKLKAWFTQRGLIDSVTRTSSGLYFRITKALPDSVQIRPDSMIANPEKIAVTTSRKVFVRYEGRLLNDSLFDSNLKSATSFSFVPGEQTAINAWEEGLLKFHKNEEGYLYAPSGLAYGNVSQNKIPANSCLRFFIRVVNVE
jgi:FKBP-type peptidyl-prolyl cis-trans isomerase